MDTCPNCKRKLLSHASIRCNWCGAEISDEGYQQKAAEERAAFRAHEAERDAIEAARSTSAAYSPIMGWGNPLSAARILGNSWQRRRQMEAEVRAQARAMEEYAGTGQGGVNSAPQPAQPAPGFQGAPVQGQIEPAQAQTEDEQAVPKEDVRSMFRHLEL